MELEKIWWFEVQKFQNLNCTIMWFEYDTKNVELNLNVGSDNYIGFLIQLFELIL